MAELFSSKDLASMYVKYRPQYPEELYAKIFEYLDDNSSQKLRKFAIDVGCGSGQSTRALAQHFEQVLGVDPSEAQLEEARKSSWGNSNITYEKGSASDLGRKVDAESVDLISVATALHFFDVKPFYESCLKLLRPRGVLAAYCYNLSDVANANAKALVQQFYSMTLQDRHAPGVTHVINGYKDLLSTMATVFPKTERFNVTVPGIKRSLNQLSGFILSMASYTIYLEQNPSDKDPREELLKKLKVVYGIESMDEEVVELSMDFFMILGKKE